VEKGAIVKDSILMPGVTIRTGAYVNKCIVGFETIIGKNVRVGADVDAESKYVNKKLCEGGITVFERGLCIREGVHIPGNCMIELGEGVESDEIIEYSFRVC
jgi:glucose-1-phosphate adenylyltransferase